MFFLIIFQIIFLEGKDLILKDTRDKKTKFRINKVHELAPTDISANPNKPHTVITGGKDALLRVFVCIFNVVLG